MNPSTVAVIERCGFDIQTTAVNHCLRLTALRVVSNLSMARLPILISSGTMPVPWVKLNNIGPICVITDASPLQSPGDRRTSRLHRMLQSVEGGDGTDLDLDIEPVPDV